MAGSLHCNSTQYLSLPASSGHVLCRRLIYEESHTACMQCHPPSSVLEPLQPRQCACARGIHRHTPNNPVDLDVRRRGHVPTAELYRQTTPKRQATVDHLWMGHIAPDRDSTSAEPQPRLSILILRRIAREPQPRPQSHNVPSLSATVPAQNANDGGTHLISAPHCS
ncbi:hypothetical protein BC628DRAFT_1372471 [Trametes gibbosa]|nr:hypothetical protein BC628DRAFT_1372471 [Trametes gibbosa]